MRKRKSRDLSSCERKKEKALRAHLFTDSNSARQSDRATVNNVGDGGRVFGGQLEFDSEEL
eukprot:1186920-Rhodomonas_salina.2